MSRIIVTGAGGQLGQSIQKIAIRYGELFFDFKGSREMDITEEEQVRKVFKKGKYDYCINCAAFTNVEIAESNPKKAFSVNAEGVLNLAKSCSQNNVVLIHVSTDYVFDGNQEDPYTVHDKPNPINNYGASKLKGEEYLKKILENYFIVRTSWLYSEFGKNFYRTILHKAETNKILKVTDDQKGCPTNATNLAEYLIELISSKSTSFGVHHFTDGKAMTWYDFAKEILLENGIRDTTVLRDNNYGSFVRRPKNSVLF